MLLKKIFSIPILLATLSGCAQVPNISSFFEKENQDESVTETQESSFWSLSSKADASSSERFREYLQKLSVNLYQNSYDETVKTGQSTVAVTSFVPLDSDFSTSDVEGLQIQESMLYELYQLGVDVVDYKATDFIRVTPAGDFAMTRDFMDLKTELSISYIVVGTVTQHADNILINTRIVSTEDKRVVSAASTIIPGQVIKDFYKNRRLKPGSPLPQSGVEVTFSR